MYASRGEDPPAVRHVPAAPAAAPPAAAAGQAAIDQNPKKRMFSLVRSSVDVSLDTVSVSSDAVKIPHIAVPTSPDSRSDSPPPLAHDTSDAEGDSPRPARRASPRSGDAPPHVAHVRPHDPAAHVSPHDPGAGPYVFPPAAPAAPAQRPSDHGVGPQRPTTASAGPRPAPLRRAILYVFSGPSGRADGLRAMARRRGMACVEVDLVVGGEAHDLSRAEVAEPLLAAIRGHQYMAVIIATPCVSYSVAHASDLAPEQWWRTREHFSGAPHLSDVAKAWLQKHDRLAATSAAFAFAALGVGAQVIIENPAPRFDPSLPCYWPARADVQTLWHSPAIKALRAHAGPYLRMVVLPHCSFGHGPSGKLFQKYTGFLCSAATAYRLESLNASVCLHASHDHAAGYDAQGAAVSALAAAYPGPLNDALAWAVSGFGQPPTVQPTAAAEPDRSRPAGRVADGFLGSPLVRAAVERARASPPKWASFRNLQPASADELRTRVMPDLTPHNQPTAAKPPPSQPQAAARLAAFRRHLGRNVHVQDLWLPGKYEALLAWLAKARAGRRMPRLVFTQDDLVPLARGLIWDCRDPDNVVPLEPSTRDTVFPGARQMDRAAFRAAAAEVGSLDADIVGQAGEGGCEVRSDCALDTVLESHLPGMWERPDAGQAEIEKELREEWAIGPFYHPPLVPMRCLPRDVIAQQRSRAKADGSIEDYEKDRITLNPSSGDDSVNSGIPADERSVRLTSARQLAEALAIVNVPASAAGSGVQGYGIDLSAAYSFCPLQRLDWWTMCYLWFDEYGAPFFCVLTRVGFGGAFAPRRFQSISVVLTTLIGKRQDEFDAAHPYAPEVAEWQSQRRQLQLDGRLPAGAAQTAPAQRSVYIDDVAGGCPADLVPMPDVLYGMPTADVDLGALATLAIGGKPMLRNSRPAVHAMIAISTVRSLGFEVQSLPSRPQQNPHAPAYPAPERPTTQRTNPPRCLFGRTARWSSVP